MLAYRVGSGVLRVYDPQASTVHEVASFAGAWLLGWDPAGRMLVAVTADAPWQDLAFVARAHLQGWEPAERMLGAIAVSAERPKQIVAVDPQTGAQTPLTTLPRAGRLFCRKLSPAGSQLLVGIDREAYVLDVATREWIQVAVAPPATLWSPDSRMFLTFSGDWDNALSLVDAEGGAGGSDPTVCATRQPQEAVWHCQRCTRWALLGGLSYCRGAAQAGVALYTGNPDVAVAWGGG